MHTESIKDNFVRDIKQNELLIHKVCRMYGNTPDDRKDLFQEIVIQLWKVYPKFRGESKFSTWLYRVSINTAITGLRKQKKHIVSVELDTLPEIVSAHYSANEEDQLKQLYTAIGKLNELEKALIILYLDSKSYQEMEDILGINEGALRVKMSRTKEKLRQLTKN